MSKYEYFENNFLLRDNTIIKYHGKDTVINIPSTVQGQTVREINDRAFENSDITEVVISEGISIIGEYAFCNCKNLVKVVLPCSITNIKEGAFMGCTKLSDINASYDTIDIDLKVFKYCTKLKGQPWMLTQKEYTALWQKKNPDSIKNSHNKYRNKNIEKVREKNREYGKKKYVKKPKEEKIISEEELKKQRSEYNRRYREKNPEKEALRKKLWRENKLKGDNNNGN